MKIVLRIFKIVFLTILTTVTIVLLPFKKCWNAIKLRYRIVVVAAAIVFFLFETITPAYWLALTMYYEARDEPLMGQYAVANVVLNRAEDHRWPNTIKGVVTGGRERGRACDFSFMCDGRVEKPWLSNHKLDWAVIRAESWIVFAVNSVGLRYDPTKGSVYYKRSDVKSPWFNKQLKKGKMERVAGNFGAHEFFR